jgi:transposase
MAKRQKYDDEFRREAVRLMEHRGSKSVDAVADDLGVAASQLYTWRSKYGSGESAKGSNESQAEELRAENLRLKRELERVSKERELLKKSIAFFVKENG